MLPQSTKAKIFFLLFNSISCLKKKYGRHIFHCQQSTNHLVFVSNTHSCQELAYHEDDDVKSVIIYNTLIIHELKKYGSFFYKFSLKWVRKITNLQCDLGFILKTIVLSVSTSVLTNFEWINVPKVNLICINLKWIALKYIQELCPCLCVRYICLDRILCCLWSNLCIRNSI